MTSHTQNHVNTSPTALSDAELRALLYFAVGVTSESGNKAYRLVVAGDRASTPHLEPADNSGYSIGTIQTDLGQHYQPGVRNGENVPRDLVDAYQRWAAAHRPEWVLDREQADQTVADLGRNGRQIRAQAGRPLDAAVQSRLDAFLASDDGITWVHERDVAQIDKLMRRAIPPLQASELFRNASLDDQARLAVMVGKAYNQNEALGGRLLQGLARGQYDSVDAVSRAIDGLSRPVGDYFESGRDKALLGAEVAIALRNAPAGSSLHDTWQVVRDNAMANPVRLTQRVDAPDLAHAYPTVRNLFVQYDRAIPFIGALNREGSYIGARSGTQQPDRFVGAGLVASGRDFVVWNHGGEGQAFIGGQWRAIDRNELVRSAPARGVLDVSLERDGARTPLLHVRPDVPSRITVEPGSTAPATHERVHPHASMRDEPLYRQAEAAVRRLDAGLGRDYDETSARMAASLAWLAKESTLTRIDHVVLSEQNDSVRKGENVFVVQGDLHDASRRMAYMKTADAVNTSVEASLARMQSLETEQPRLQPDVLARHETPPPRMALS